MTTMKSPRLSSSKVSFLAFGVSLALGSVHLITPSEASAAVVPITAGITAGDCADGNILDTSFEFGSINTAGTLANILNAGDSGSCYNDDKLYIFNRANLANNPQGDDIFSFNVDDVFDILEAGNAHTLRIRPLSEVFTPANPAGKNTGTYKLDYDVEIYNSNLAFASYATNQDGSAVAGTAVSSTRTLSEAVYGVVCDTTNGNCGLDPDNRAIPNNATIKLSFESSLDVLGNYVDIGTGAVQFSDTIRQKEPPASVPGPLPVLGASAAFAYSRKLRNRICPS